MYIKCKRMYKLNIYYLIFICFNINKIMKHKLVEGYYDVYIKL